MPAAISSRSVDAVPTAAALRDAAPGGHRLYWIDWLRFLAAATVLLDHLCATNWTGQGGPPDPHRTAFQTLVVVPIHLGREAVIVFFVLSGALVGGLTWRKVRAGTFDAGAYATDRFARLYVPLVPALLLTAASVRAFDYPLFPLQYVGCLLGLHEVVTRHPSANGPLWSLAYEMWFYVLAGCAATLAGWRNRSVVIRLVALTVGALALGILCLRLEWTYLGCWLLGATAMGLSERIGAATRPWVTAAGFAVMLAGVVAYGPDLVALIPSLVPLSQWSGLRSTANLTIAAGTLLFIVGVCRWAPSSRAAVWIERLGTTLAAFSYTLYLTHFPILRVFAITTSPLPDIVTWYSLLRAASWAAVCVAAALVMYVLFEAQTPRVRRWLRARWPKAEVRGQKSEDGRPEGEPVRI